MIQIVAIIVSISLITTSVQLLLKKGVLALKLTEFSFARIIPLLWAIITNPYIITSVLLLVISFALWLLLLSKSQLSVAYPAIIALNFVFLLIASRLFLKEVIAPSQILGMVIITLGIFLLLQKVS